MIHGKRMVLERGMEVGHGRVPGIARLGKETEIGELQTGYQFTVGRHHTGIVPAPLPCVEKEQPAGS